MSDLLKLPEDASILIVGPHPDDFDAVGVTLRFHDSQHQRNLNTRGHGFDERILQDNRLSARELGIETDYAEVFELEELEGR